MCILNLLSLKIIFFGFGIKIILKTLDTYWVGVYNIAVRYPVGVYGGVNYGSYSMRILS